MQVAKMYCRSEMSFHITVSIFISTVISQVQAERIWRPRMKPEVQQCSNTHLADSINNFGASLTKVIGGSDNFFVSPFSIYVALAMTYLGAGGESAREIENAFQLPDSNLQGAEFHKSLRNLMDVLLNGNDKYSLLLANDLFLQQNFNVENMYLSDIKKFYKATLKMVDFLNNESDARKEINGFVAENTNKKIEKFLFDPLDPSTVLALINAVYFKGFWEVQFPKGKTKEAIFHKNDGSSKKVMYMILENEKFRFYEDYDNQYKFLELPYKGKDIAMLLALPDSNTRTPNLDMTSELFCKVNSQLRSITVKSMWLPKFQLKYRTKLDSVLKKLGIQSIFTSSADLSGIRKQRDIKVSTAIHEAVIDVNEKGTEAAAVTGIFITPYSFRPFTVFQADHPFSFYIIDKRNRLILFSGRLSNP